MSKIYERPLAPDLDSVKQEPIDVDFKSELIEGANQFDYMASDSHVPNPSTWSLIVDRTLFMLQQEENRYLNHSTIIKALIKEVNDLLYDVVNTIQDCCNPISPDEQLKGEMLEVDGLIINCLPCLPDKFTCHYKIKNEIPQYYRDSLFSLLNTQYDGDVVNQNYIADFAPNADIEVKQEPKTIVVKKAKKISKKDKVNSDKESRNERVIFDNVSKNEKVKSDKVCDQCGKTFKNNESVRNHIRVKHEKKKIYKCRVCEKTFSYRTGMRDHRIRYGCKGPKKENKWIFWGKSACMPRCIHPDCVHIEDRDFTPTAIFKHIMQEHTAPTEFDVQCPDCPKKFPMARILQYHREIEHHVVKKEVCTICGKAAKRIKEHMKRFHVKEKNIQCDKCDYRCRVKSQLSAHMRIHIDPEDRKYKCEICFKGFLVPRKLKEHILTHANIKPFKCEICGQVFSNHSGHRQHIMRAHGLKFTCEICGFDSASQKWLNIHKRDKHGIGV